MRSLLLLLLLALSGAVSAAPLSGTDEAALRALSENYANAWVRNDRAGVMGVMAPEAVFIPHDGVRPRIGHENLDAFWFPNGKAVGTVPAYTQTITAIGGDDRQATMYGRFDLSWQNGTKRYNWIGNWLIVARKDQGRWLITHMMANDAEPTISELKP
jgi:uncharacterized protein (TIGR02246 family)